MDTARHLLIGFGKLIFGFILLVVCLIIVLCVYLTTDHAKTMAKAQIHKYVNTDTISIDIDSIESFYPLKLTVNHFAMRTAPVIQTRDNPDAKESTQNMHDGQWLHMKNISLSTNVLDVFSETNRLVTLNLDGDHIYMGKIPPSDSGQEPSKPLNFDDIKKTLKKHIPLDLDIHLNLKAFDLDPAYINIPVTASLKASTLSYKQDGHMLAAKFIIETRSFGKPLIGVFKFKGPIDNFTGAFAIRSQSIEYKGVEISELKLQGSATGLPLNFRETMKATFKYGGVAGELDLKSLRFNGEVIRISDFKLDGLNTNLTANAEYNLLTSDLTADVIGTVRNLEAISKLANYPMTGSFDMKANIMLTQKQKTVDATFHADHLKSDDFALSVIDVNINSDRATKEPNATVNITLGPYKAYGFDMKSTLAKVVLKKGIGNVTLTAQGDELIVDTKADVNIQPQSQIIHINTFKATYLKQPIKLSKPFSITRTDRSMSMTPMDLRVITFPIYLSGTKKEDSLDLVLKAQADLTILSQLFLYTGDIIKGDLSVDLKIGGTPSDPQLNGFVDLKNGEYENLQFGTKLYDINVRAIAKGTKIALENVKTNDGHRGHLEFNGYYDLKAKDIDMTLRLVDMRLAYTDALQIEAREGDISISGQIDEMLIKGKLKTGDVAYDISETYGSDIATLNIVDPATPNLDLITGDKKDLKSSDDPGIIKLDLVIDIPKTVRVFGLGIESMWGGKLNVGGTIATPIVIGNIKADSGKLSFLGNDIKIEDGSVRFDGQDGNIPYLALIAGLQKTDYKVVISISGRASKPTFELKSEPNKPQDEILANLLFNTEKKDLSPFDAVKLATTLAQFGGFGNGMSLSSVLQTNKKRDRKDDDKDSEKNKKDKFKSDKRFSDYVKVDFDQGATPADSKVIVDVQVTPKITVSSETGTADSSQSIGVKYRWDY